MQINKQKYIKQLRELDNSILDIHSKICEALCNVSELDPLNLTLRGADGTVGELVPLSQNSTSERKPASGK